MPTTFFGSIVLARPDMFFCFQIISIYIYNIYPLCNKNEHELYWLDEGGFVPNPGDHSLIPQFIFVGYAKLFVGPSARAEGEGQRTAWRERDDA